jgi:DNA-damage-inducible protein J
MVNDATVRARINSKIKEEATAVLAAIGLTPSDAFRLLRTRVAKEQSLIGNQITETATSSQT